MVDIRETKVQLLHDHIYTIPGGNTVISLKAGDKFSLAKKVSAHWWAVFRSAEDTEILYVPSCYAEELSSVEAPGMINGIGGKNDLPLKPPIKLRPSYGRHETPPEENKSTPKVTDEAQIELFNILTSYQNNSLKTEKVFSCGEMENNSKISRHKGSMQSLDLEFVDDEEFNHTFFHEKNQKSGLNSEVLWTEELKEEGKIISVNQVTGQKWVHLCDETGREYFFNDDTQESLWELPEFNASHHHKLEDSSPDGDIYQFSNKTGVLYKARLSENGKKIKKSWSSSYLVLCGSMLYFYKEQKVKPNMSKPEAFLDLRSVTVNAGGNTRSSRKNLIQLTTTNGTEYLLHHDEVDIIEEWREALSMNVVLLSKLMSTLTTDGSSHSLNSEIDKARSATESPGTQKKNKEKAKTLRKGEVVQFPENPQPSADKTRLKEKLRSWLKSRPSRDSLRANGIYKENVFGSHLLTICDKENSSVPKFVRDCIEAIESRGLTTDGIYRLSGNMAEIQKLRYAVNQNDDYDLLDPDLDVHVVTGALKLFFRELLEPVFPFRFLRKFLDVLGVEEPSSKSQTIKELIVLVPTANYETIKELFRHLVLVIKHCRENRMQSQNIAIIFGPTLMWPEETDASSDLATSLVQRGQFIDYILHEYSFVFGA